MRAEGDVEGKKRVMAVGKGCGGREPEFRSQGRPGIASPIMLTLRAVIRRTEVRFHSTAEELRICDSRVRDLLLIELCRVKSGAKHQRYLTAVNGP